MCATTPRIMLLILLIASFQAANAAGEAMQHSGRSMLQTPDFTCTPGESRACGVFTTLDAHIKGMVVADGYLFVSTYSGRMLRCLAMASNTCVTFNTLAVSGGPMAVASPGWIIATSGSDMVRCSTSQANSCELINQCDQLTRYESLIVANNRIYAGLTSGILWSCDIWSKNSCQNLDKAGDIVNALAYAYDSLWAAIADGVLWRCDPNRIDACNTWDASGSNAMSLVATAVGDVFVYLINGIIWKCASYQRNNCVRWNSLASGLASMVMVQGRGQDVYVGNDDGVFRCPTQMKDSCVVVARSTSTIHELVTAVVNGEVMLFAGREDKVFWIGLGDGSDRAASAVTGLRFVPAPPSGSAPAACTGPASYDAGMRVGAAGLRLCVDTAPVAGERVLPGDAGKLLANITIVAGRRAFWALRCPPGFSKHETDINGGPAASPRGPSMAVCMQWAPAGTPVSQLVKSVLLHPTCKQPKLKYTRLRGNLNSQAAGQPSAFVCLGYAAGGP